MFVSFALDLVLLLDDIRFNALRKLIFAWMPLDELECSPESDPSPLSSSISEVSSCG